MRGHRLLHHPQVLLEQPGLEAGRVVGGEHALAVHLEHAAGREPAEQRLTHLGAVDAGLARQRQGFGDREHRAADDQLVARLADLAGARGPDVDDPILASHPDEDRPHPLERGGVAADHEGERALDRADFAAAHRGVEIGRRRARRWRRQSAWRPPARSCSSRRSPRPAGAPPRRPAGPSSTASTSGASGSIVTTTGQAAATAAGDEATLAPASSSARSARVAAVVHDHGNPVLAQVERHGAPHRSQPDEPDGLRHSAPPPGLYPAAGRPIQIREVLLNALS